MQVNLKTLGCRLNEAETELWGEQFQAAGHQIVNTADQADLIVLNTCAVTSQATRKSRQLIRRLHRHNPTAKIVVSGCYASLNTDHVAATLGVDLVVRNSDKDRLVDLTQRQLLPRCMPVSASEPGEHTLFKRGRQRAFIKVQDGCRYRCAFCIVTVARGEERSRPIEAIVTQINTLHTQGIHEVILTGVHLGGYGSDIDSRLDLLIQSILAKTRIPRIRLGSLEPWELPDGFLDLFQESRLMPHLHLPLQSGSDTVLRRMARRCKVQSFARLVEKARQAIPDFNITTDIIVGFPGETEQEWSEGLANIEDIGFGHIHIFSYSPRLGTKAACMDHQVPTAIKKQRSRSLHNLARSMKLKTYQRFLNHEFPVLWESPDKFKSSATFFGYTPNYLRVAADVGPSLENSIKNARINEIDDSGEYALAVLVD